MQCVYLVVHAVYTFTYPAKREHTVHLEVKGGGGLHCCHVFKIQSSVGGQGNYQCGNLLHTVWHDIISMTIRWKTSTWSRSIRFLVSSPDPTQGERVWLGSANPSGFITTWAEFPIRQSHCRKHHLWFQHWKPLATSAWWQQLFGNDYWASYHFSTASYEFFMKPMVLAKCHLMGGVLPWDNLMNLMVDHTALCS